MHSLPHTRLRYELVSKRGMLSLFNNYFHARYVNERYGADWIDEAYASLKYCLVFAESYSDIAFTQKAADPGGRVRREVKELLSAEVGPGAAFRNCFEAFCRLEPCRGSYALLWRLLALLAMALEEERWNQEEDCNLESLSQWERELDEARRVGRGAGSSPRVVSDSRYRELVGPSCGGGGVEIGHLRASSPGESSLTISRMKLARRYRCAAEFLTARAGNYDTAVIKSGLAEFWKDFDFEASRGEPSNAKWWPGASKSDLGAMLDLWRALGDCPSYTEQVHPSETIKRLTEAALRTYSCYLTAIETMKVPAPICAVHYRSVQVYGEWMIAEALLQE